EHRRLDHVAGQPRVLSDDHAVAMLAAQEEQAGGLPYLQRKLGRDGRVGPAADAVGSEILAHDRVSCPAAARMGASGANHLRAICTGRLQKSRAALRRRHRIHACGWGSMPPVSERGRPLPAVGTADERGGGGSLTPSRTGGLPASRSLISSPESVSYSSRPRASTSRSARFSVSTRIASL